MKRGVFFIFGWIVLSLGVIGVFLPLLPTTPFVLLAAWSFAKSSKRYHEWIRRNRLFGSTVRAWEARLGLTLREKIRMTVGTTIVFAASFILCPNTIAQVIIACCYPIPLAIAWFTRTRDEGTPIPPP